MTPREKQKQREDMINTLAGAEAMRVRLECGTWYGYVDHDLPGRVVQLRESAGHTRWVRWEDIEEVEKY